MIITLIFLNDELPPDTWPGAGLHPQICWAVRYHSNWRWVGKRWVKWFSTWCSDMLQGIRPQVADRRTLCHHVSLRWPRLCRLWKWASFRMRLICRYDTGFVGPTSSEDLPVLRGLQGPTAHWLLQLPAACSGLLMLLLLSLFDDSESQASRPGSGERGWPLLCLLAWGTRWPFSSSPPLRCRFLFSVNIWWHLINLEELSLCFAQTSQKDPSGWRYRLVVCFLSVDGLLPQLS